MSAAQGTGAGAATPTEVSFVSKPTTSDYIWNSMAMVRASTFGVAVGTFGTILGLLTLAIARDLASLAVLVGGIAMLTGAFVAPFTWWSVRQRRDLTLAPVSVVADATGIALTGPTSTARHDWSVFRRVRKASGAVASPGS